MGVRLCGPVLRFSRKVWGGGRAPVGTLTVLVPQLLDACFDVILGGRHREVLALDPTPRRGALAGAKCGSTDRNIGAISSLACGVSSSAQIIISAPINFATATRAGGQPDPGR